VIDFSLDPEFGGNAKRNRKASKAYAAGTFWPQLAWKKISEALFRGGELFFTSKSKKTGRSTIQF
jgi:hypothetical protein